MFLLAILLIFLIFRFPLHYRILNCSILVCMFRYRQYICQHWAQTIGIFFNYLDPVKAWPLVSVKTYLLYVRKITISRQD